MPIDKVIFQNPDGTRIEIPKIELADGCVMLQDHQTKECFYVDASLVDVKKLRSNRQAKQAKRLSPDQIKKTNFFVKLLDPFFRRSIEEWMDEISRETDPDQEISVWTDIASALNATIVENPTITDEAKVELFKTVLSLSNTGDPQLSLSFVKPTACKPEVIVSAMRHFVKLMTDRQNEPPVKEPKAKKSKSGK